jgi:hypothetical protein
VWARVTTFVLPPDELAEATDRLNAAIDAFLGKPGLARADVYLNRKSGNGITITVWESQEQMRATEEAADHLRQDVALEVAGWVDQVREFELIRSEPA